MKMPPFLPSWGGAAPPRARRPRSRANALSLWRDSGSADVPRAPIAAVMMIALGLTLIMTPGAAMAQSDPKGRAEGVETRLTFGTATPGGGFPVYGAAFVETVREADPSLVIEARNTMGSAENIPLLEEGRLDIALVQGEAAHEAFAGIGRPPSTASAARLRASRS